MSNVCIIPCAGAGTRLGLPYPKELHHIEDGVALIDLSMQLIARSSVYFDRVVIVTIPAKAILLHHLHKWWPELPVSFTFFNDAYTEWAGSILSAKPFFGDRNIVLLPDTLLVPNQGQDVCADLIAGLANSDLVLGAKAETDPAALSKLGALSLDAGGCVTEFQDKPKADYDHYNGFWTCFGFTKAAGPDVLAYMSDSIQHKASPFSEQDFRASGFWVRDYIDFGTWPSMRQAGEIARSFIGRA